MKILNIIGSVDVRGGGTTNHVFSSSRVWTRLGHECHVLCLDAPNADCVAESPLTTIALGQQGKFQGRMGQLAPFLRYGYTPMLGRWLNANALAYDAVILNGLWNYTSYGTWLALRNSSVPYYVCPHGMLDPWLKKTSPAKHLLRTAFWNFFEQKVIRDARGIFFACEEERQLANRSYLRDRYPGYVLGYGTEDVKGVASEQKSAFLAQFPQLEGRKYVLFLGRIHPKKGLDLLVKSFARLADKYPDFDLVIAGPDDVGLKPQLKGLVAGTSAEKRVHWTGMLSGDAKWGAFRLADYFALSSHQENFGISVVEAMALSVPVLISKQVNIWREVEICGAGIATTDELDGVTHGLQSLLDLSRSQRQAMAERARDAFLARFNLDKTGAELLNLIKKLNAIPRHGKQQFEDGIASADCSAAGCKRGR
jgi:glycosyltransferase involved in cell wall biosynthesis